MLDGAQAPILFAMAALLAASAFFSGSETALFALTQQELATLKREGGVGARAAAALLASPRRLLITLLLGNMLANVMYFVLASVLTLHARGAVWATTWSIGPIVVIILVGEVLPKLAASAQRVAWCQTLVPALFVLHRISTPIRTPIDLLIVSPLARLIAPPPPPPLRRQELQRALEHAVERGVIDPRERAMLSRIADLNALRVRDVMTPRVRMAWLSSDATRRDALALAAERRIARAPLCDPTPDQGVVGVVDLRQALALAADDRALLPIAHPPVFAPEQATLDDLIGTLRRAGESMAVVVDEFGAVAGVASLEDAAERLLRAVDDADSPVDEAERES